MKKTVRLTESELIKLIKKVVVEQEEEGGLSLMDVSSDSDYYQQRKREVSIPQNDLSTILSIAKRWCVGKDNLPDCQRVDKLYLNYYL
jgi:hypothetical protein